MIIIKFLAILEKQPFLTTITDIIPNGYLRVE